MPNRVAITGLGAISSLGYDVGAHLTGIREGTVGIGPTTKVPVDDLRVKISGEVSGFEPERYLDARKIGLFDRCSQFALIASREAVTQAGEPFKGLEPERVGVIFGASSGYETLDEGYKKIYRDGATRPHPFSVPKAMPSSATSAVSIDHAIKGPSFSIASACSSAAHAIGMAFHMIRTGMLDAAVTGGCEAPLCPGVIKSWEALRVLSTDACRPFSKDRSGIVLGEGAGAFVLENWDRAVARGAAIHGELIGFGMTSDGADMTAPVAESGAKAMTLALRDAGVGIDEIGYVNAHGTGTALNDKTESASLRQVFGNRLPGIPVSSTKSMYGHCLSAAGALDMIMTVLALRESIVPPTMSFRELDPECDIDCVPNAPRTAPIEVAMSNSFAFGGLNAVLVARRFDA